MNSKKHKIPKWQISRQINLSVFIQLVFLAALIVGTWVNLQKQLTILQHDITLLIKNQNQFHQRIEKLGKVSICYEYRLRAIEKQIPTADISTKKLN
ncbi:MAG: hypothetical protein K8R02_02775 [Anaerohalosphaeraceae bacterium]|nr:hypothetical protein [Anaerohalosphaeraceae bacterium]